MERLVRGQEVNSSNPLAATILSQMNALRWVLAGNFYFIFTDNRDNICGFAWKVEIQPNLFCLPDSYRDWAAEDRN